MLRKRVRAPSEMVVAPLSPRSNQEPMLGTPFPKRLSAIRGEAHDADVCVRRIGVADHIERVGALGCRYAFDQCASTGALNAAQHLLPIDVKDD